MTPAWGPIAEGGDSTSWRIIEEIHFIFAISLIKKRNFDRIRRLRKLPGCGL
jgi:hypothetical protein